MEYKAVKAMPEVQFQCLKKLSPLGNATSRRSNFKVHLGRFNALKSFHPLVIAVGSLRVATIDLFQCLKKLSPLGNNAKSYCNQPPALFQCLKKLSPLGNAPDILVKDFPLQGFNALKSFHPLVISLLLS